MQEIKLKDHTLSVHAQDNRLELSFKGQTMLHIHLGEDGPVVAIEAADLSLKTKGRLAIDSGSLHIRTRGDFIQQVGGNGYERVAGNKEIDVRDDLQISAQAMRAHAVTGSMDFKANDDLSLSGLRVLHNVPTEDERLELVAKAQSFGEMMACPAYDPKVPRRLPFSKPLERSDWDDHAPR